MFPMQIERAKHKLLFFSFTRNTSLLKKEFLTNITKYEEFMNMCPVLYSLLIIHRNLFFRVPIHSELVILSFSSHAYYNWTILLPSHIPQMIDRLWKNLKIKQNDWFLFLFKNKMLNANQENKKIKNKI